MDPSYGFGGGGSERNLNGRGGSGVGGGGIAAPRGYAMSGKIMLSAIVVLFTVVLLILFLHLYVRWRLLRSAARSGRRRGRRLVFAVEGRAVSAGRGRGLDSDALKSLPTLAFSVAVGGGDAGECAVCLSEFEEGEKVRSVPRCGHLFHIECIDSWLRSHVTCPLCRAAVEPVKPAPADERLAVPAAESDSPAAAGVASPSSDLCESCRTEDGTSSSSSESSAAELRIEVRSGAEDELGFGIGPSSGFKSPGGRIQAIRRILSRDLRPCGGGSLSELDLERGEAVEGSPPPPPSPVTPTQLPN